MQISGSEAVARLIMNFFFFFSFFCLMKNTSVSHMINKTRTSGTRVIQQSCVLHLLCDSRGIEEWLKWICQCSVITQLLVCSPWSFRGNQRCSLISLRRSNWATTKRKTGLHRTQTQPRIYPRVSISPLMIHVLSPSYTPLLAAARRPSLYYIKTQASVTHFFFFYFDCTKQTLFSFFFSIIMIIIICWESSSPQIGSRSIINRCVFF